jgi:hypothetical protein
MKRKLVVTLVLVMLCTSIIALNATITPILADNTEIAIAASPAEPVCPEEPECPPACPEEPTCPEEPACPQECPEEPECPAECPAEPACPNVCGPTVTSITGFGWFDVEACPNPDNREAIMKQTCDYNLSKGAIVQFKHDWDVFGEGVNINNLNTVELADGTWYMWGTNVLEFCGVTLSGYVTGIKTPDDQLFARYVNYGENMLVIWDFEGNLFEGNVTGVIVEDCDLDGFACAWPDVTWHCGSEVTPFTGWAEPAMIPPVLDPGVLAATVGDWELWKGTQITYFHYWDSACWVNKTFGDGKTINTFNGIADTTTGSQVIVGTHEITFDCLTLTGTVTGHIFLDDTGNRVTIGTWVSASDGYLVLWHYDSRLERQDYGVIIEL